MTSLLLICYSKELGRARVTDENVLLAARKLSNWERTKQEIAIVAVS